MPRRFRTARWYAPPRLVAQAALPHQLRRGAGVVERGHEPALARDLEQRHRPEAREVNLERAHAVRRRRGLLELGLGQRLTVDEHLGQKLERRDPPRAVALDLVAHGA